MRKAAIPILFALGLTVGGCAAVIRAPATAICGVPEFGYRDGWLGGDAAYSIALGGGRSVWLFGDSFVGAPSQRTREGAAFVHNSIGVSRCRPDEAWQIEYFWQRARGDQPHRAFLETHETDRHWWLFDGFVHDGALFIGLLEVRSSEPRGPLNLPFRFDGMQLARIENPEANPNHWQVEILPLSDDDHALPGSAMEIHGDHVYLFTFVERNGADFPRILTRLPLAALDEDRKSLPDHVETLRNDGIWISGFEPDGARVVMDDNASEMSVHFDADRGRWMAVYSFPNVGRDFPTVPPSDTIWLRSAEHLEGPWSAPRPIHRIAELHPDARKRGDPNTFCYAGKAHPQLARPGELFVTYVCNLYAREEEDPWEVISRLLGRMDLYRPRTLAIPQDAIHSP